MSQRPARIVHGTTAAYHNHGCRCEQCTEAHRVGNAAARARMAARTADIPHGTVSGYSNWDCRCDACRVVHSAYRRARRLQPRAVAVVAFLGLAVGVWGADAAIVIHRHARPPVVQPAPRARLSPVLTSTHGGAR